MINLNEVCVISVFSNENFNFGIRLVDTGRCSTTGSVAGQHVMKFHRECSLTLRLLCSRERVVGRCW
jgi:hypothetical protein